MSSDRTINFFIVVAVLLLVTAGMVAASLTGAPEKRTPLTSEQSK